MTALRFERYVTLVGLLGLFCTQTWSASNRWRVEGCTRQSHILTCTGVIPPQVPQGIKEVTMLEITGVQIRKIVTEHLFCHASWSAIGTVSIFEGQALPTIRNLYDNMFVCLGNLTTLKLMLPHLDAALPEHSFAGLDKVTTLDMSNCEDLSPTCFFEGLKDSKNLPNLSNLVLHKMNTIHDETTIFTKEMFQTLSRGRNITQLDMSNTRLSNTLEESANQVLCQTLQVLNVSGVRAISSPNDNPGNISPCYSLETLDVSGWIIGHQHIVANDVSVVNENKELTPMNISPKLLFFINIKTLYSSNVNPIVYGKYLYIYNSMWNISVFNNLKHVDLSNNKLKYVDGVLVSEYIRLESLDLSRNDMEYLTPRVFQQRITTSLRNLDISHNTRKRPVQARAILHSQGTSLGSH